MQELRGMPAVNALKQKFTKQIEELNGIIPKLAVVRVGECEDDIAYERGIIKRFSSVNAEVSITKLPADVSQSKLEETIAALNGDKSVHGILLFRPLPGHLSIEPISNLISGEKDVDCMGLVNSAHVFAGGNRGYAPCTPQAVIEILDHYGIELKGKKVTVVGRSLVVGKPLAMLLIDRNATVTVCHTRTLNLAQECKASDILIACAGSAGMITAEHVRAGQVVIDVGINMVDGKLCGDVDYAATAGIVEAITPVPGGVGTVTTSVLLKHTINSAAGK